MKKLFTLALTLIFALTLSCAACAEEYKIDTSFDGVVFTYEDINMQIKIPSEWYRAELEEAYQAQGFFDCFGSEEGVYLLLAVVNNPIESIIETVQTDETIQDPEVIYINEIEALTYVDVQNDCYGTIIPFADGASSVLALMGPTGDDAVAAQLMTLMATIDTIQ